MDNNSNASTAIDFNNRWSYPLQWLYESELARQMYQQYCFRVNLAMEGKPWKNTYQEEMNSNLEKMDAETKAIYQKQCMQLPEGTSHKLYQATETIANQMASGVDTYECEIYDPYMVQEADTADKLIAMCNQDYIQNDLGLYSSLYSRDLTRYGLVAVMVKYNPKLDRNEIFRINPKNCWFDTMYSSTGHERFRGYSTMISWAELKKMVKDDGDEINLDIQAPKESIFEGEGEKRRMKKVEKAKYSKGKIRSLNGLDIYVKDLNELAQSPSLQGGDMYIWEYAHDLMNCYNLNFYRSFANKPKAQTNSGYHGQDVELTVVYDLTRGIEFKIINRRFVISMNKKAFNREILMKVYDPLTNENRLRLHKVNLKCPLQFRFSHLDSLEKSPFPTSPLFNLLDTHDKLCGWRAKREHVSQIMSILRLETNGADAQSLRGVLNVMGVVLDDVQGDINSLMFNYSYDPIDSQIAHYEQVIQETLSAYTQFDAMQLMGDRASAAESGMAIGAIAQGLATHQNTLMALYADIARQCIMNRVLYSPSQEFPVMNRGGNSSLSIQEMALDTLINVKPKFAKKVLEKQLAANAMALASNFAQQLAPEDLAYFIQQAMFGNVPRGLAERMVGQKPSDQETALAMQQAQNTAEQLKQNQQLYLNNPIPYETGNVLANNSPEEIDQIIAGLQTPDGSEVVDETMVEDMAVSPQALDMTQQEGSLALQGMEGMNSDLGSMLANSNSLL